MAADDRPRWNHNLHLHPLVMSAVPAGACSALDVGTGNGLLAAQLRTAVPEVVAIDIDAPVLETAKASRPDIDWVHGDAMTYDFGRTFDIVASVATVHHLPDLGVALRRFAELTSPGGAVVVVGLARDASVGDRILSALGAVQHWWLSRTRTVWEHSAPTVWPPPHTYREVRRIAAESLPGVRWRRSPLWRYALVWRKP